MPKTIVRNIIPGKESDAILIYGDISPWDVSAKDIVSQLMQAAYTGKKTDVRICSNGGDILEGIAMFSALRDTQANVELYIDGVAASMASVLCACGKPVHMGKYSRMMLHTVQGGTWGTPTEIQNALDLAKSLQDDLVGIYAKKMGLTPEEVNATYFDGQDHWLTADECLRLKLIDSIYDSDPIDINLAPKEVYQYYINKVINQFNSDENMDKDVRKKLGLPETATEAEVIAKIEEMNAAKTAAETAAAEKDGKITTLQTEVDGFKQKEQQTIDAEDDALIEAAVLENKLTADQKPAVKAMLKANREEGTKFINSLKPFKRAAAVINQGSGAPESAWSKRQAEIDATVNAKKR
jgi:ATP-dependent protease ClpP protease subunit